MPDQVSPEAAGEGTTRFSDKAILVFLLACTAFAVTAFLVLFFFIPYFGFQRIHPRLPAVFGLLTGTAAVAVLGAIFLFISAALRGRDVPFSRGLRSLAVKGLLPVLVQVGRVFGISRETVQHAFVAVNNQLVMAQVTDGRTPRRILLLMPHCLQYSQCPVKITYNVENCKRCGQCPITELIEVSERYGVDLAVATGGTIARRIVVEKRPDLIVAVACERDLVSGIRDTTPLPVYGIFNLRPNGPCLDTRVPMDQVVAVLDSVKAGRRSSS